MAIKKKVKMDNGVTVSYHRIALINIDVNQQITLLIESYIDEEGREYMKSYARGEIEGEPAFPYMSSEYHNIPYDETLCIFNGDIMHQAYEYIKTFPQFENAEDILEDKIKEE